jgi:DNA helicase II / ATP-dependent DNA helicase PcrA
MPGFPPPPLDEFQLPFAQDRRLALRLLAPAGAGKTQTLLWRSLELNKAAGPASGFHSLLVTFTRAARLEMQDRIAREPAFAPIRASTTIATLNAWGFRRLMKNFRNLRIIPDQRPAFKVFQQDIADVVARHWAVHSAFHTSRARGLAPKRTLELMDGLKALGFRHDRHLDRAQFHAHVAWLTEAGARGFLLRTLALLKDLEIVPPDITPEALIEAAHRDFLPFWAEATVQLFESRLITLEDQKYWTWLELDLLVAEGVRASRGEDYGSIIVDEFQDINPLDLQLLRALSTYTDTPVTIVGDDDQAIFEWRGAVPTFILEPERFLGTPYVTHVLGRNYRSPANIVGMAQRLIRHNGRRVEKAMTPMAPHEAEVQVVPVHDVRESVSFVLDRVRAWQQGEQVKRVAIMGRKRNQIIPFQILFAAEGIPFFAAEDLQVFLSDTFESLILILECKARANQETASLPRPPVQDLVALMDRVKRYPLSEADRSGLVRALEPRGPSTLQAAILMLRDYRGPLKGANGDGARSAVFAEAITEFLLAGTVAETIHALSRHFAGMDMDRERGEEDIFLQDPPFIHLAEFAERYGSDHSAFVRDLRLAQATLARKPGDGLDADESWKLPLHLMTAIRSKGKEFDAVVLLDVVDGIWPAALSTTEEELEQERRVFYVAVTRAKQHLLVLVTRFLVGEAQSPSPYLGEMGLSVSAADDQVR